MLFEHWRLLMHTPKDRPMLDARFSHICFWNSLHTLQRGLSAIADLLVTISS